jgi:hypothetical protein
MENFESNYHMEMEPDKLTTFSWLQAHFKDFNASTRQRIQHAVYIQTTNIDGNYYHQEII